MEQREWKGMSASRHLGVNTEFGGDAALIRTKFNIMAVRHDFPSAHRDADIRRTTGGMVCW